jgi:hypothetical protein
MMSKSHCDWRSVSQAWCQARSGAHDQIFITVWQLRSCFFLGGGALCDERMGLSFVYAANPCQRSLSRVRVPWDSRPYFTVSDLRLPFSSPPTTHRVKLEVFDPASTRFSPRYIAPARTTQKTSLLLLRVPSLPLKHGHSCSLATAVVLSPVYTTVTWQCVNMSQYIKGKHCQKLVND